MLSARKPRTTYKEKTMLNLLHVYISPNHSLVKCSLTRDPRDPFTFVDPFDP